MSCRLMQFVELAVWLGFITVMLLIGFQFMLDVFFVKNMFLLQEILAFGPEMKLYQCLSDFKSKF